MTTVSVHEAKTHLSRLLKQVQAGHEVVIENNRRAVARLVPMERETKGQRLGLLKGKIALDDRFFEPLPDDELAAWEGN
jgi:prevent-host-death family protein